MADMPFERVASKWAARNQVRRGTFDPCMIVPAVTEVCRAQSRHSHIHGLVSSRQAVTLPHAGQTKPFGQRRPPRLSTVQS